MGLVSLPSPGYPKARNAQNVTKSATTNLNETLKRLLHEKSVFAPTKHQSTNVTFNMQPNKTDIMQLSMVEPSRCTIVGCRQKGETRKIGPQHDFFCKKDKLVGLVFFWCFAEPPVGWAVASSRANGFW